jgi:hypothetical protein
MSGQLWNSVFQIGKETTAGTAVAATRKMYFREGDSKLALTRAPRPHKFATGTRDNQRAFTVGPTEVSGSLVMPLSASEIIELLLGGVRGGVTPTGSGTAKLWTFTPGTALDSLSIRWHDGARPWVGAGCLINKLKISGDVKNETLVTAEVIGRSLTQTALTGSLNDRIPDFIEGWETKIYIDSFGGTAGSTLVSDALINWEIELDNMIARKYYANNSINAGGLSIGELGVKAKLTFEASTAMALTEYNNWNAATRRLVRLFFGDNEVIDGSDKKFVTVDLPGAWETVDLGGTDEGTRTYEMSLDYVYDVTNAFGLQIRAQNARATAY